jgi:hypothetical protein
LSGGIRADHFGEPDVDEQSGLASVVLGTAGPPSERVRVARLRPLPSGNALFTARSISWQGRVAASVLLDSSGDTLIRAGYGLFADRPYENLWVNAQTNDLVLADAALGSAVDRDYLQPASVLLAGRYSRPDEAGEPPLRVDGNSGRVVAFEPQLRNPLLRSTFISVERRLGLSWSLAAHLLLSRTDYVSATDRVNREIRTAETGFRTVRPNSSLPSVYLRTDDGFSRYRAFLSTISFRNRRVLARINYTWSHSRDNQSDALADDFDLLITTSSGANPLSGRATFTRNYDFRIDYGPSDFDQRHNLVGYWIWDLPEFSGPLPWLTNGWRLSQTVAIRSGFPFSVFASRISVIDPDRFLNNRANQVCNASVDVAEPKGRRLLRAECFTAPEVGDIGNTGRNAFYGPGLMNTDFSVARTFTIGERRRLILRADIYNLLNHANLDNPESRLYCEDSLGPGCFGLARYGRREAAPAFPAQKPLVESARRIQLMLRFEF